MAPDVGIVIPAYRPDISRLAAYIDELWEAVEPATIRVELDAPAVDPATVADRLAATVAVADDRRGKGMAITAGFDALDTDVLAFADADGATDPDSVDAVVDPVRTGEADLSVGSRRHPHATLRQSTGLVRPLLSVGLISTARRITGIDITDFQCGAKAIDRHTWQAIRPHVHQGGFGFDLEVIWLVAAAGASITEVPVDWEDRPDSTVSPLSTTVGLGALLARIAWARIRGHQHLPYRREPLCERMRTSEVVS